MAHLVLHQTVATLRSVQLVRTAKALTHHLDMVRTLESRQVRHPRHHPTEATRRSALLARMVRTEDLQADHQALHQTAATLRSVQSDRTDRTGKAPTSHLDMAQTLVFRQARRPRHHPTEVTLRSAPSASLAKVLPRQKTRVMAATTRARAMSRQAQSVRTARTLHRPDLLRHTEARVERARAMLRPAQ